MIQNRSLTKGKNSNKFDLGDFASCFNDLADLADQPSFEEKYGEPKDLFFNYRGDKGESRIYPLVKEGRIETLLLARDINDGHYISRTTSLSAADIDGTLVSAGMSKLFRLLPSELSSSDQIQSKLGNGFLVSRSKDGQIQIEEQIVFSTNNDNSVTARVASMCDSRELAVYYANYFGIEGDNEAFIQGVINAINVVNTPLEYCVCPVHSSILDNIIDDSSIPEELRCRAFRSFVEGTGLGSVPANLTPAEDLLVTEHWSCAYKISKNRPVALSTAEQLFGEINGGRNGCGDAFRHALFNALNVRSCGSDIAAQFANAHEQTDPPPSPDDNSVVMDNWNNNIGNNIAVDNPTADLDDLTELICTALESGFMQVLEDPTDDTSESIPSGDCDCP